MSFFHPGRSRIDRYLAHGLGTAAETRLRRHLHSCERCRAYYDEGVRLLRAARGVAGAPGSNEDARLLRLVMTGLHDGGSPSALPRRALFAFAGVAAAAAVILIAVRTFPLTPVVGRVVSLSGEATIGEVSAALDTEIASDVPVEVRTGEMVISLEGGRTALLRAGAKVRLARGADTVTLEQGRGRFTVTPGQGDFAVVAGTTVVSVKGTTFIVERKSADDTLVAVHEGVVEVSADKGSVRLLDGQETTVKGGQPSAARAASRESLVEDRGSPDLLKKLKKEGTRILKGWEKAFGQ